MFELTKNFLEAYLTRNKRHRNYDEACKLAGQILTHADGTTPDVLLTERRPGESEYIFKYRKAIYQPKTKTVIMKVLNTLSKIRRSSDWSIKYDDVPLRTIPEGQRLSDYAEQNYPEYRSITKWYFDVCLKKHITDPNSVVFVHPYKDMLPASEREYIKPVMEVIPSKEVYEYKPGELAVLCSEEKCSYTEGEETRNDGDIIYVLTPEVTYKVSQASSLKDKWKMEEHRHNLGYLPCFMLGAIEKCKGLYESRISGMIPSLNVAVTLYSDKQAEIVQHVHSEKWIYQTQQCRTCAGSGSIPSAKGATTCPDCKGNGVVNTSPYSNLVINPNNLGIGEKTLPTPPAGYIQKADVAAMLKAMSEEIQQEIRDAYSAVNMEFLNESPLAQSGVAKEVDRDELNNFVHAIAEDIVGVLDRGYFLIALMRYGYQVGEEACRLMCPKIAVPEKFDLLSSDYYQAQYKAAMEAKMSPHILTHIEEEFASRSFYNNPEIAQQLKLINSLDPMPSVTEEDKMLMLNNKGVTQEDYIISSNIESFVKRAILENPDFASKQYAEQKKIIAAYAAEVSNATSGKEVILG